MAGIEWIILDLETTGLSSKIHEVTEISAIKYSSKIQLTDFVRCEHPERANVDAMRITNKTLEDLSRGISKEEAVDRLTNFLELDGLTPAHRCIVAHNASFDRRFIHALYEKVGKSFPANLWICSMALTKEYAKKIGLIKPKVNLNASCDLLEIKKYAGAHASKIDTRNTYLLFKALIEDKQMDYLSLIKTMPHFIEEKEDEHLDINDLDIG